MREGAPYLIHGKNYLTDEMNLADHASITRSRAFMIAKSYMNSSQFMWNNARASQYNYSKPKGELIYLNPPTIENDQLYLAYVFDMFSVHPFRRTMVYVDATTGDVLCGIEKLRHITKQATAQTRYMGTRTITVNQVYTNTYLLSNVTRGQGIQTLDPGGSVYLDRDNFWSSSEYNQHPR